MLLVMLPILIPGLQRSCDAALGAFGINLIGFALTSMVQFGPARRFHRTGLPPAHRLSGAACRVDLTPRGLPRADGLA